MKRIHNYIIIIIGLAPKSNIKYFKKPLNLVLTYTIISGIIISTKEHKKQTTGTARTTQANEDIRSRHRLIEKF